MCINASIYKCFLMILFFFFKFRLRALETSLDLLQSYKGKYAEQKAFVSQMSTQVESMKCVSRLDHHELHREIESSTVFYINPILIF